MFFWGAFRPPFSNSQTMHRRSFFKRTAWAGTIGLLAPGLFSTLKAEARSQRQRVLRVAHITDVHILDQKNAMACFGRVLSEINRMEDRPDFIINTGDTVMDENKQTRETVAARWRVWNSIVSTENKLPIYSALGNHDVWYGPDSTLDAEYKKDRRYGKQWAVEELKLPSRYYSFQAKGWTFIALDSVNGATGYQLDEEQFEWLAGELRKANGQPVCVFNHVPIISAGAVLYLTHRTPALETKFPVGDMHLDHQRIKNLFVQHTNVKICLSGHVHYIDEINYLGVKYICNGAVSGNWWRSPLALDDFPPAYAIVDFYSDGSVENNVVFYNHQA